MAPSTSRCSQQAERQAAQCQRHPSTPSSSSPSMPAVKQIGLDAPRAFPAALPLSSAQWTETEAEQHSAAPELTSSSQQQLPLTAPHQTTANGSKQHQGQCLNRRHPKGRCVNAICAHSMNELHQSMRYTGQFPITLGTDCVGPPEGCACSPSSLRGPSWLCSCAP